MGIGAKEHTVFIIDFGKTKKFRSAKTSEHISLKNNNNLILTDKFASINSLKGMGNFIINSKSNREGMT